MQRFFLFICNKTFRGNILHQVVPEDVLAHRREVQQGAREVLCGVSAATHQEFPEILRSMDPEILKQCGKNEAFMSLVRAADDADPIKQTFLEIVG